MIISRKIKDFSSKAALRVPLAVTRLTVYRRQLHIYGLATFGVAVLVIALVDFNKNLGHQINSYDLDFHQGASLYIHCARRTTCRWVSKTEKIMKFQRKIKNFSSKAALRVSLAVTRLTVYRQLHITRRAATA